jgi:hypothetical protein
MSETQQRLKLRVDGDCLRVKHLDKSGQGGKRYKWRITKKSNLPRELYFLVHNFVRTRVNGREDDDFDSTKKAVLRGLCEAAVACGCKPRSGKEGADVCWFLHGEAFFSIQIHDGTLDDDELRRMRKGHAVFRWAITIEKGGYTRYHPRRTRLVTDRDA